MKNIKKILFTLLLTLVLLSVTSYSQVSEKNKFSFNLFGGGLALTGSNSNNTSASPAFGGNVAYGLGHNLSIFAESGYGYTNINSVSNRALRQFPIIGGITYNLNSLFKSDFVQPYIGVGAGAYVLRLKDNGSPVFISGFEQKSTNFGANARLGVNFIINQKWGINVFGNYTHIFDKTGNPGIESSEFNSIVFGGGINYSL